VVLDSLADNVMVHSLDGRLLWLNRNARELVARLGMDAETVVGKQLHELPVPPALVEAIEAAIAEVRARGEATREVVTSDGRWHEDRASLIRGAAGTILGIAFVSRDIHERKVSEARIRAYARVSALPPVADAAELLRATAALIVPDLADWAAAGPGARAPDDA